MLSPLRHELHRVRRGLEQSDRRLDGRHAVVHSAYEIFHGGIPGGRRLRPAGVHDGLRPPDRRDNARLGNDHGRDDHEHVGVTNNPATQNMTKQTLGNRSFINQVKYSPKYQSVAIVGTNDGNVWIGSISAPATRARRIG